MILPGFSSDESAVSSRLDPHIQMMKFYRTLGRSLPTFEVAPSGLISIISKVTDLNAWKLLADTTTEIPLGEPNLGQYIVTARLNIDQIDQIVAQPFVLSLKVAQTVKSTLKNTLKETGLLAKAPQNLVEHLKHGGAGVVVGVVDFGCDFHHDHFIDKEGKTRLLSLWDQTKKAGPKSPKNYAYGREYLADEINKAIKSNDPYQTLNYYPEEEAHGTHVMDIAAGHGTNKNFPGIAPKADLVFVHLGHDEIGKNTSDVLNFDAGDSVKVVEAVKYVFDQAGDRPCVVNLSFGAFGGPHDGTTPVEQAFDALLQKPNRAIVISAGNSYGDRIHVDGIVKMNKPFDIEWEIKPWDKSSNEMEIWYGKKDTFELEVLNANGMSIGKVSMGKQLKITTQNKDEQKILMHIIHSEEDPDNHDRVIHILQDPMNDFKAGKWIFRLHGKNITGDGKFHAWVEWDPGIQSRIVKSTPEYTLGTFANGKKTIVVGSYNAAIANTPISSFSSAGPTRKGEKKPEIISPGENVLAAASKTKNKVTAKSGTSMAAPAVTGLIARIFGIAISKGILLTIDQTRDIIINKCQPLQGQNGHNPRYGFGKMRADVLIHSLLRPGVPKALNAARPQGAAAGNLQGQNNRQNDLRNVAMQQANDMRRMGQKINDIASTHMQAKLRMINQLPRNAGHATDDDDNDQLWNNEWAAMQQGQYDELELMMREMERILDLERNDSDLDSVDDANNKNRPRQLNDLQRRLDAQEKQIELLERESAALKQQIAQQPAPVAQPASVAQPAHHRRQPGGSQDGGNMMLYFGSKNAK